MCKKNEKIFIRALLPLYLVSKELKKSLETTKAIFIQDNILSNLLLFCKEDTKVIFFKNIHEIEDKEGLILIGEKLNPEKTKKNIFLSMSRVDLIDVTEKLEYDGFSVYPLPSISFKPLAINIKIPDIDWIIFTSKVGVNYFFKIFNDDIRKLNNIKFACVGKRTKQSLSSFGIQADVVPETFMGEGLIKALSKLDMKDKKILLAQAETTRGIVEKELKKTGAKVEVLSLYRNVIPPLCYAFVKRAKDVNHIDYALFTSPSAVKHTMKLFGKMWENWTKRVNLFITIGPITAKILKDYGKVVYPSEFTIKDMLEFVYRREYGRIGKDS
ncbi:MAG: uroporphyrinogen-III synthase [Deltaproteobacteria bacterium]|nr:uroporphyrinogen-III synthase [Deltaproteobacteria bacterium]